MNHADPLIDRQDLPRVSMHAQRRIRQRGLKEADLGRLQRFGEEVEEGYLMTDRKLDECIAGLKSEIQRLERLRGLVLIEQGDTLVTLYRSDRRRQRRLLGGAVRPQSQRRQRNAAY